MVGYSGSAGGRKIHAGAWGVKRRGQGRGRGDGLVFLIWGGGGGGGGRDFAHALRNGK